MGDPSTDGINRATSPYATGHDDRRSDHAEVAGRSTWAVRPGPVPVDDATVAVRSSWFHGQRRRADAAVGIGRGLAESALWDRDGQMAVPACCARQRNGAGIRPDRDADVFQFGLAA